MGKEHNNISFYQILGLDEKCSEDDIKKSYRKLSFMHHPDKNNNSEESKNQFQKINEAYEILSNPDKRQEYDMTRNNPFLGGGIQINPMDIFNMFMGGTNIFPNPQMNGINHKIHIFGGTPGNFQQMHGMPNVFVRTFHNGVEVNNHGNPSPPHDPFFQEMQHEFDFPPRTPRHTPPQQQQKPPLIAVTKSIPLPFACQGGTIPVEYERWSIINNMSQLEKYTEYISLHIGTEEGEVIILSNKGNESMDRIRGDVKITFSIEEHPIFKRNGLDLILEKNITLKESLCGFTFDVEHINGKKFQFNNSAGNLVKDGLIKTIPKLGLEKNGLKGNLNVKFNVVYPSSLSNEQISALENIL